MQQITDNHRCSQTDSNGLDMGCSSGRKKKHWVKDTGPAVDLDYTEARHSYTGAFALPVSVSGDNLYLKGRNL